MGPDGLLLAGDGAFEISKDGLEDPLDVQVRGRLVGESVVAGGGEGVVG